MGLKGNYLDRLGLVPGTKLDDHKSEAMMMGQQGELGHGSPCWLNKDDREKE